MDYIRYLELDINLMEGMECVKVKQGDSGSRFLNIKLMNDGTQITADASTSVQFRCIKPDGKAVLNYATKESNGTVTVALSAQTMAAVGRAYCDIVLSKGTKIVSTVPFILDIVASPDITDTTESKNDLVVLNDLVNQTTTIVAQATAAKTAAEAAATRAETAASSVEGVCDNFAPEYSATSGYAVGDMCIYNNKLYICTQAIASAGETWTAAHWDETDTAERIDDINDTLVHIEAESTDVGRAAIAKTVSGGKVTEWELGETQNRVFIQDAEPDDPEEGDMWVDTDENAVSAFATTASATLTTAGWTNSTQTISVTGVKSDNIVAVCAAPSSKIMYDAAKIVLTAQGNGTLTFTYQVVPSGNITVNILIIG